MAMSHGEEAFGLFTKLLSALGFAAIGTFFLDMLQHRNIGRRLLLWTTVVCCFVRAAASVFSAYNTIHDGNPFVATIGYFIGSVAVCCIGASFWSQRASIIAAVRSDRTDDLLQADIQLRYLEAQKTDAATLERSEQLVTLQREGLST